jgi:hypothetical protein
LYRGKSLSALGRLNEAAKHFAYVIGPIEHGSDLPRTILITNDPGNTSGDTNSSDSSSSSNGSDETALPFPVLPELRVEAMFQRGLLHKRAAQVDYSITNHYPFSMPMIDTAAM